MQHFHAIILAGGRGRRAGLDCVKQIAMLGGRPMLRWSVDAFAAHPRLDEVVVVVPDDDGDGGAVQATLAATVCRVAGGVERQDSVRAGLDALPRDDAPVLIHDAARPGLTREVIDRLLAALDGGAVAAVPALPVTDTLVRIQQDCAGDVVDRDALVRVQTPQAFDRAVIAAAHQRWSGGPASDDAQMVRALGHDVALVTGDAALDKVTLPGDLERMERLLTRQADNLPTWRTATGSGFDVHRLTAGDGVWLGGVMVPCEFALVGHSDADVMLHAITDAVLGALSRGDIGSHFPPSDPRWKGAASDQFLAHAISLVHEAGGTVEHLDVTLIGERPKMGPHREAIRQRIADIANVAIEQVGVKATTTEQLGFTGRGEGLAAQAVASLLLPRKGPSA